MKQFIIELYPSFKTLVPKYETTKEVFYMFLDQQGVYIRSLGDSALVIQFDVEISAFIHNKIMNIVILLETKPFAGFIEAVPGYNNITVYYDPVTVHYHNQYGFKKTAFEIVSASIIEYVKKSEDNLFIKKKKVNIPVLYGERFGPDLEYVAKFHDITPEKVIELHTNKDYLVYMLGFAPGFPYLADLDEKIATPRKTKPRPNIPIGSVGIAGKQTGMYPLESPGGWQVIGQTPVNLFTPKASPPTLLKPGDEIRFIPITEDEYYSYKEME